MAVWSVDRMTLGAFETRELVQAGSADQGQLDLPVHASTA
jgi:hypothetical protein